MPKSLGTSMRVMAASLAASTVIGGATAVTAQAGPVGVQQRVSFQGPGEGNGDPEYDATDPAIAYSGQRNNYMVVWSGDAETAGEDEIWARFVGANGQSIPGVERISRMGPDGNTNFDAFEPKVAYNATADEFLIVWHGTHDVGTAPGETEIWGRRIRGDGTFTSDQFRISEMGKDGNALYEGTQPDVVYNPDLDQYVVVWRGDQPTPGDGQDEIWARRLNPDGSAIDADELRITNIGPSGGAHDALEPEIAYNPDTSQYLVVFHGDDVVDDDFEIHGQRLDGRLAEIGADDHPISQTAGADRDASSPEVAYNPLAKRFMVVWHADKIAAGENEIYGQLIDGAGAQVGTDDFRISTAGPDGNADYEAVQAMVVSNDRAGEFLVAWSGGDDQPGLVVGENEIFAQRFTGAGAPVGISEPRLSSVKASTLPTGDPAYDAFGLLGGAYNALANEYLVSWEADHNTRGLLDDEFEVYSRRHSASTATEPAPANCRPVPPRGTPNPVGAASVITASYLKTNQRTGAATVRRANAANKWLNGGIVDWDICGGSLTEADLDASLTATSGPLGPVTPEAVPRKVAIAPASNAKATFTADAIQMCINQRIYQAAIARANALRVRLDGRLTGGDLTDGTLTQGRLRQDLTLSASSTSPTPPPASTTDVIKPRRRGCGAVKFTTQQAAINRRIAIRSVVRINEVLDELAGGLDGANFENGTINKVDFAAGVTP